MLIVVFRLLALLAQFVIKLIKQYGMLISKNQYKNGVSDSQRNCSVVSDMKYNLHEMSRFLEVTRKMQHQLQIRRGRPHAGKVILVQLFWNLQKIS